MNTKDNFRYISRVTVTALTVILATCPWLFGQVSLVEDINPGTGGSGEFVAGAAGTKLYFKADDGTIGREFYMVDGLDLETVFVQDIWPISNPDTNSWWSSEPGNFTAVGSSMYFTASGREDPVTLKADFELWVSTGSTAASLDIWPGTTSSDPSNLVEMGGALFFLANDEAYEKELHTVSGLVMPETDNIAVSAELYSVDLSMDGTTDTLFLMVFDDETGHEPWISNGTEGGTLRLKDVRAGPEGSSATGFVGFLGKAWFRADDGTNGTELWVTNGTEGGTNLFLDIDPLGSGSPWALTPVGSQLFFTANDGINGFELWVSDGLAEGTTEMVVDLTDGVGSSSLYNLTAFGDVLAFTFDNGVNGEELWTSDGTSQNTGMVKDIWEGSSGSAVGSLTVANGLLFFGANDGSLGPELWVSDGTSDGTQLVCDVADGWNAEGPSGLTLAGDLLFFQADSASGRELHVVDTTDIVTQPSQPTVSGDLHSETTLTFTTGGSVSIKGSDIQYRFYWGGDEVYSDWLDVGVTAATHSWDEAGTYAVFAEARSTTNPTTIFSCPSSEREVTLTFNELISEPDVSGSTQGGVGEILEFSVVGESSLSHPLEYQVVTWGDGESVNWTDLDSETNTVELAHAWDSAGTHNVQIHIRCREHSDSINWVDFDVEIAGTVDETISQPIWHGHTAGWTGHTRHFTLEGGSNTNHQLQYYVDWGNGATPGWVNFPEGRSVELSTVWNEESTYYIDVQVRCATHTQVDHGYSTPTIGIVDPPEGALFADGFESSNGAAW